MEAKEFYLSRPWLRHYRPDVPDTSHQLDTPIPALFAERARRHAGRVAVHFYGGQLKYGELLEQSRRLAAGLADLGVRKGDRVALYLLNTPQFVVAYMAILTVGAVVTPISPVYTSPEVRHQLTNSGARVVICQDILYDNVAASEVPLDAVIVSGISEYLPWVKRALGRSLLAKVARDIEIPDVELLPREGVYAFQDLLKRYPPDPPPVDIDARRDLAVLPYTGGTTGPPKGAMLTHSNVLATHFNTMAFWPVMEEGRETVIAFLPFYHIYGQVVAMINTLFLGGTLILFTTVDLDDIVDAVDMHQATALFGVPTFFEYLKEHARTGRANWKRLKLLTSGADTLHETTVHKWEERTGSQIHEGYGLTETAAVSHANPLGGRRIGSFGIPIPNVDAAVVDADTLDFMPAGEVGELILSGPNIMQGYWQAPEETARAMVDIDGRIWFRTGDLVRMDETGYFYFYDRKKDLIKFRGYSVFAREIEDYLYQHPMIKAAGVIGVPDQQAGQLVKAIVVLEKEARGKMSEQEVQDYCRLGLAHYKVPRLVEFRGELPQTDVGKISRRELREEMEDVS